MPKAASYYDYDLLSNRHNRYILLASQIWHLLSPSNRVQLKDGAGVDVDKTVIQNLHTLQALPSQGTGCGYLKLMRRSSAAFVRVIGSHRRLIADDERS